MQSQAASVSNEAQKPASAVQETGRAVKPTARASSSAAPPSLKEPSRGLLVYRPATTTSSSAATSGEAITPPRVILLFGWMDAPARIVTKYAQPWIERFPSATVVVRLSSAASFLANKKDKEAMMKRLVDLVAQEEANASGEEMGSGDAEKVIEELADEKDPGDSTVTLIEKDEAGIADSTPTITPPTPSPTGTIIHTFSDGGSTNLTSLLDYLSTHALPVPHVRAHIIDSSPGISTARSSSKAFAMAHQRRHPLVYWSIRAAIYLFMRSFLFVRWISGQRTRSEIMRWKLNDKQKWKWPGAIGGKEDSSVKVPVPRLYLYSKADALIASSAVEKHARDYAASCSLAPPEPIAVDPEMSSEKRKESLDKLAEEPIQLRRYERAPHCDLGRHDYEGYWAHIDAFLKAHGNGPFL